MPVSDKVQQPLLYLASASPRRSQLLDQIGLAHSIIEQNIDESVRSSELATDYVLRIACEKARAAMRDPRRTLPLPVLAADTSVVCDGQILGKPADENAVLHMLGLLSGRSHQVMTAVAIADSTVEFCELVTTTVTFRDITRNEILAYHASAEPADKAGAYAIQGAGAIFVSKIEGSYSAVVGLPLYETMQLLANFGIYAEDTLKRS